MKLAAGLFFGRTLHQCRHAGLTLNVSRYAAGADQPLHVHTHPTFFVPIRGDHRDQTRHGAWDQQEMTLAFHSTHMPHASAVGRRGLLGLNLEFEPEWLERHELTESDLGDHRLLDLSVWSRLAVLRLVCLASRPTPLPWDELHSGALELLEPLLQHVTAARSTGRPPWLRRGEDFLHAGFRASLSLRDVAREAGVHPVYFARVFRQRHGCPVSAYLRALRLAEACRLVLRGGRSLAEAAQEAGFADQSHLSRCCSRQFGFSPRAVRSARDFLHS